MTNQPPLNPDALEAVAHERYEARRSFEGLPPWEALLERNRKAEIRALENTVSAYLAVAQPALDETALANLIAWKSLPFGATQFVKLDANAAHKVIELLKPHLAVAQPVVNSVEELITTRAGLALANAAFNEGLSAGIRACNESLEGEPFVKPVSPYSAPLLAMIKADRPAVNDA